MKNLLALLLLLSACPAAGLPADDDDATAGSQAAASLPSSIRDAFASEADGVGASLAI